MDRSERAVELLRAEAMLNEAADIIDRALRMSGFEQRGARCADSIREIASGRNGRSIRNIALDMKSLEEDPLWTRPLDSPKRQFGERGPVSDGEEPEDF